MLCRFLVSMYVTLRCSGGTTGSKCCKGLGVLPKNCTWKQPATVPQQTCIYPSLYPFTVLFSGSSFFYWTYRPQVLRFLQKTDPTFDMNPQDLTCRWCFKFYLICHIGSPKNELNAYGPIITAYSNEQPLNSWELQLHGGKKNFWKVYFMDRNTQKK